MVGATGFEPATPSPPVRCATKLRYAPSTLYSRARECSPGRLIGKPKAGETTEGPEDALPLDLWSATRRHRDDLMHGHANLRRLDWFLRDPGKLIEKLGELLAKTDELRP